MRHGAAAFCILTKPAAVAAPPWRARARNRGLANSSEVSAACRSVDLTVRAVALLQSQLMLMSVFSRAEVFSPSHLQSRRLPRVGWR